MKTATNCKNLFPFVTIPETKSIDNQQQKTVTKQKLSKYYQKLSTDIKTFK